MLDLHGDAVERVPGVTQLLDPDGTIGRVPKGQGGNLVVLHIGVLGTFLRQKVILGRDLLSDGVMALKRQGDDDCPIRAGGERAHLAALRVIDGEYSALQGDLGALLQLHDLQRSLLRVRLTAARVAAHCCQFHVPGIVQVADIILQIAVLVLFLADCVHGGILGNIRRQGELDAAALALDAVCGVQHFEFPAVAVPGPLRSDGGNVLIVLIHDAGPLGHRTGVCKGYGYIVVIHPCFAPDGEYLLFVLLAVHSDRVGSRFIRGGRHPGFQHIIVGGAPLVDILGRRQDAVADVQLRAS